ncbi:hypothetical protein SAMN04488690_4044 [Stenotrophomonas indicatrix]|uniref:Uncharacterized protein n=2 Tax=Stenotrophomonas indicatrix TaxID=2045451 RepID=A0A1W1H3W2_9GAMM|nr:hypothetical protein SAMN04488690_4044 [Stenotrophomonas indicatrix]
MMETLLNRSALLLQAMLSVVDHPVADGSVKVSVSRDAALLSLEHAAAMRLLMEAGLAPSAAAMLRCQYEAFTRSVWILHCASDEQLALLSQPPVAGASERHLPMLSKMIEALASVPAVSNLIPHLLQMKEYGWGALNSFVHAGTHALDRSREGFPEILALNVIRISNNLAMECGQQLAILTGQPPVRKAVLKLVGPYADCLLLDHEKLRTAEAEASTG